MKKLIFVVSFIVLSGFLFGFSIPDAKAATVTELQAQIQQLQALIASLQQQLAQLQPLTWCHAFNTNLGVGNTGPEVTALQTALLKEGLYMKGTTGNFDEYTASIVVAFQEKYASEVLASWGLTHGTGYVGPTTRAKLNKLYGCEGKEVCVQKGYACCLGDVCNSVMITCKEGEKIACKGCDANCNPQCGCQPSTSSITVISPNGGETWMKGQTYNITWKTVSSIEKVTILVLLGNQEVKRYTNILNNGVYSWTIPQDLNLGTNYKIDIMDYSNFNVYDQSDNYFSIVSVECIGEGEKGNIITAPNIKCCSGLTQIANSQPTNTGCIAPTNGSFVCSYCGNGICGLGENRCNCSQDCKEASLTVISPNGGEKWMVGNTYDIKWELAPGSTGVGIQIAYILEGSDLNKMGTIIAHTVGTSYRWSIPSGFLPGKYRIQIHMVNGGSSELIPSVNYDYSDNYFSIISSTPTCTDSDGGRDYFIKGTVAKCESGGTTEIGGVNIDTKCIEVTDTCISSTALKEYYCENQTNQSVQYTCSYGCKDGACQAGITVISPNGGEKWEIGKTYGITWASEGTNYKSVLVNIYLWKDGVFVKTITLGVSPSTLGGSPSIGKYSWTILSDLTVSDKYQVSVYASGIAKSDISDNYFSIIHPLSCTYLSDGVQSHYMATCGTTNYDPVFDLNKDKIINASDFGLVSVNIDNEEWCNKMKASTENPCEVTSGTTGL